MITQIVGCIGIQINFRYQPYHIKNLCSYGWVKTEGKVTPNTKQWVVFCRRGGDKYSASMSIHIGVSYQWIAGHIFLNTEKTKLWKLLKFLIIKTDSGLYL